MGARALGVLRYPHLLSVLGEFINQFQPQGQLMTFLFEIDFLLIISHSCLFIKRDEEDIGLTVTANAYSALLRTLTSCNDDLSSGRERLLLSPFYTLGN